ncbi:MAG: metal-dependent hydrolase, partial [Myxococcales bacterium]|nr:metal-dependent hydrolase [Myxococcales bacterium]
MQRHSCLLRKEGPMQIKPRSFPLSVLRHGVPRHWLGGSALATHLANGVNLLFPAGERFFVRSVRHYLKQIEDDPTLVEAVRGFAGQEGHHARAHEEVFELLEQQGFEIKGFLRAYEAIAYRVIERLAPPALRLATTAAAEHFTAVMAENFLTEMVDEAGLDPAMRQLFMWHACEEIEHRAVAFEVFQRVDGRYPMRMAGLAMATATLAGFWIAATIYLLRQEERGVVGALRRDGKAMK